MELNPEGILSVGMKIGRRSADLLLIDFTGKPRRKQLSTTYDYPLPEAVFRVSGNWLWKRLLSHEPGKGYATGFAASGSGPRSNCGNGTTCLGLAAKKFRSWKNVNFFSEVAKIQRPASFCSQRCDGCLSRRASLWARGRISRLFLFLHRVNDRRWSRAERHRVSRATREMLVPWARCERPGL